MRRENRRRDNEEEKDSFKSLIYFFGGVLGLAVLTFVLTFTLYSNKLEKSQNNSKLSTAKVNDLVPSTTSIENSITEQASTQEGKTVEEATSELTENSGNVTTPIENETPVQNATKKNTGDKKPVVKKELIFERPVEGDIILEFAMEKLVYSDTLKEWITHPGVDIKAERTTVVKAAEDGKVKAIKNDPRYGLTVIIEHESGFTTVYSNLLTAEFVTEGEEIKKGQTLGTIGNTAIFESVSEPHLHFEILKDNEYVDPTIYVVF